MSKCANININDISIGSSLFDENEHRKQCISSLKDIKGKKKFIPCDEDKKCAPGIRFDDDTCFSLDSIIYIANEYNKYSGQNIIKIDTTLQQSKLKLNILKQLRMIHRSDIEWLREPYILDDVTKNKTFRPYIDVARFVWLSNEDIINVLAQYEYKYNNYKSYGAVPRDAPQLKCCYDISRVNLDTLYTSGITRFSVIFNHDTHNQRGSHWVALYIDLQKKYIYYYDSAGKKPRQEIDNFATNIVAKWICNHDNIAFNNSSIFDTHINTIDAIYNTEKHQYEGSECGVYSIYFVYKMLKGGVFQEIVHNMGCDKKINRYRDLFFRFSE